jgi:hypothetical protein
MAAVPGLARACLLSALAFATQAAWAQPKAVLTKDIDGPGRESEIYRASVSGNCDLVDNCRFSIPVTVPAGRRLIVAHVSTEARLNADSPGLLVGSLSNVIGGSHRIDFSAPGPGDRRGWNGPVTFYVEPGETLNGRIRIAGGALFVGGPSMNLMGHFVNP